MRRADPRQLDLFPGLRAVGRTTLVWLRPGVVRRVGARPPRSVAPPAPTPRRRGWTGDIRSQVCADLREECGAYVAKIST